MGTTLTGTTPQDTYDSLIKVTDNGPLSGTLKALSDGLGNDSTLSLSTTAASIAGTLEVSGDVSIADKIVHTGDTNTAIRFPSVDTITFETSGAERMRITSAGVVEVRNSAPVLTFYNTDTTLTTFQSIGDIDFYQSDPDSDGVGVVGRIRSVNESSFRGAAGLAFYTGDASTLAERVRITTAGILELTQGQIKFPATQVASADPNTLDDYEEGTWTMGVSFGNASVGVTYTANLGTYTKIGRQVTVNGYLTLSSKGSSTGTARITGLPFTIATGNSNYAAVAFAELAFITRTGNISGYGTVGATTIFMLETSTLGVISALTDANFAGNSTIMVSFTYFV